MICCRSVASPLAIAHPPFTHITWLSWHTTSTTSAADNTQIAALWNEAVPWSTATFETELRTPAQQEAWLTAHSDAYPALVLVADREVLASGALSPYRAKPAYSTTVEDAVYVKVGHRGQGLGHDLLDTLLDLARAHTYHTVMVTPEAWGPPEVTHTFSSYTQRKTGG
jgi:L-amino acid N-acyltransferase YncA